MNAGVPERAIRKVALISLAGTSIEWYDFFIYATAAALIFPKLFFPPDLPPLVALLASFSTFAVGFLARPVGGVVFGHFGDRAGRKQTLVAALLIMGVATLLIGCLPGYASIGVAAPLLLIALRFAQGFAIGGQWAGAVLLITESAPRERRGFYGSFAQAGAPVGIVLANLAFLLVSHTLAPEAFIDWGWRLPFLLSIVLIGLALFVQLRIEDTAEFRELRQAREQREAEMLAQRAQEPGTPVRKLRGEHAVSSGRSPVLEAVGTYWREIGLAAGAFVAAQVTFYILVAFVIAYGSSPAPAGLGLPRNTMLLAVLLGALAMIPSLFISAAISDRFGRRGIYMLGAALLAGWAFALFPLMQTGSFVWISVAIGVGQVLVGMMYGPQAAFLSEMFSTRVRYSGASLGYQLGAILGGALAPLTATAVLARYGGTLGISIYIAVACLVTIVCTYMLRERHREDMQANAPNLRAPAPALVASKDS